MEEEWITLLEFPLYEINNFGDIVNRRNGRRMATSTTKQGVVKVGLFRDGKQHTRSVAVLVANIFVYGYNDLFDTIIHLDGDLSNCIADNLMWRPRWFSYVYHRQFSAQKDICVDGLGQMGPIYDKKTGTLYQNVLEVSTIHGLLVREIFARTMDSWGNNEVWPTRQIFEFETERDRRLLEEERTALANQHGF
jgi:hypothetical protein